MSKLSDFLDELDHTEVISGIESLIAKLKTSATPAVQVVEVEAMKLGSIAWESIKTKGLQDIYQLALDALPLVIPGTAWTATLANLGVEALKMGKDMLWSELAAIGAQAQADLITAGKLLPPVAPTVPATA